MNKVILIGRVGQEPKTTKFNNGGGVTNISLVTTKKFKTSTGETKEETHWHNVSVFGKLSEIAEKYVKKGMRLAVCGEVAYREYEKDGIKRISCEIRADEIEMLDSKPKNTSETAPAPTTKKEDDLPF